MPNPVNTVAPVASGNPTVGMTFSCTTGSWTNSPTAYSYQWQRETGVGTGIYADITSATSPNYVAVTADVGRRIRCEVDAINTAPNLPPFTPVRTFLATTTSELNNYLTGLQPGDYIDCNGTFPGQIEIRKNLNGFAVLDLTDALFPGSSSSAVGLYIVGARNIRTVGGEFTNPGGDGIRVEPSTNIDIYDPYVHNTGSQGILVQGNGGPNVNIRIVRPEVTACGNISKDSHTANPGTGLHCMYFGGALFPSSGEIIDANLHDQAYGCGIEIGANGQNLTVTNPVIVNMNGGGFGDAAGNAFNLWGGGNRNVVIDGATGSGITGNAVQCDDTVGGSPAGSITVQNCSFSSVSRTPKYEPASPGVVYISCT